MTSASSVSEKAPSFGYHPDPERIDVAFDDGHYARALVLDGPVRDLVSRVTECRSLWQPEVELPEGLYWFQGIDEGAPILQVAAGAPPGDAMITPLDELTDSHPLVAAWGWAEKSWQEAAKVPDPVFEVNGAAVTQAGDLDVVIRDRQFLSKQWSYTVIVDGRQQNVVESPLKPGLQLDDPRTWVTADPTPARRFGVTLTRAKFRGKFANTLFSFRVTRTNRWGECSA